jgi:hypothetical protein
MMGTSQQFELRRIESPCLHGSRVVALARPEALQEVGLFFSDVDKIQCLRTWSGVSSVRTSPVGANEVRLLDAMLRAVSASATNPTTNLLGSSDHDR